MVSLILDLFRLLNALWRGIKTDGDFRILLYLLLTLLAGATVFYSQVEKWSVIDSLYFSVMTMSTIGYGDLTPTTPLSKIFTILFAMLSIGVFVAVIAKIVAITLEQSKLRFESISNNLKSRKNKSSDSESVNGISEKEN